MNDRPETKIVNKPNPGSPEAIDNASKCSHENMIKSKAMVNGWSGRSDFLGEPINGVTMSMNPRIWKLVDVMKCDSCGFSVSDDI